MEALVCTAQGIGNVVMATPTVAAVASMGYTVDVLLRANYPGTDGLLKGWEAIRDVFREPPTRRYDAVVRTVWHRGRPLGLGPEIGPVHGDLTSAHEADADLSAARAMGFTGERPPPHVEWQTPDAELPPDYLVCAPGYSKALHPTDWRRKAWPHWDGFCRLLRAELPGLAVVALGSQSCGDAWNGRAAVGFWGALPLKQAAGVLKQARAVVSIDNGIAHMAGALNAPTFALFGATSERHKRPLGPRVQVITAGVGCRPCQFTKRWDQCADWRCMSELRPETAIQALKGG